MCSGELQRDSGGRRGQSTAGVEAGKAHGVSSTFRILPEGGVAPPMDKSVWQSSGTHTLDPGFIQWG